ncbi:MAG: hypothetical protein ACXADU_09615 [Promethearchaeota archaeon]|jgi:hypothetical protein
MVLTPSLAEEMAAARPAGPPPTTKTSVSANTGIFFEGSLIKTLIHLRLVFL